VDRRRRIGGSAEDTGSLSTSPLQALAEPLGQGDRLVPVADQGGHDDQLGGRQVALLAMKRQVARAFCKPLGGPQIASGNGTLRGHPMRVSKFQPGHRRHPHRRQQLDAPHGAGGRGTDLAAGQLDRGEVVQRSALGQRVTDLAGQRDGAVYRLGSKRVDSSPLNASAVINRACTPASASASAHPRVIPGCGAPPGTRTPNPLIDFRGQPDRG
jgi:hypothetical protein